MGSAPLQWDAFADNVSDAERISAALDGEGLGDANVSTEEAAAHTLAEFLATLDSRGRKLWTEYHAIGDALRSDELTGSVAASAAFVARFSAQLASEPHWLAPPAFQADTDTRRALLLRRRVLPAFAVAAAAATLTWMIVPQLQGTGVSHSTVSITPESGSNAMQRVALAAAPVDSHRMQGSPREMNQVHATDFDPFDQYLAAHQQFAQRSVVQSTMPLVRVTALAEGK